jgi:3-deoxy-manno-octulosonate cytidylyltransferase (CMP-KDO synthetase)
MHSKTKKKFIIIIPARMRSNRLPGKPLIKINGMPMVIRTYKQCLKTADNSLIYIATDSKKIKKVCEQYGAQVIITSEKCLTGTDRVAEVARKIDSKIYINVQGDEPIFDPHDLKKLIRYGLKNPSAIVSGYCEINEERMYNDLNVPKVVLDKENYLMYASRAPIPSNKKAKFISANRQICAYSFPKETLKIFSTFKKKTYLESIEDIEYLRFLEVGIKIKCIKMSGKSLAVDNSYDLNVVSQIIKKNEKNYG